MGAMGELAHLAGVGLIQGRASGKMLRHETPACLPASARFGPALRNDALTFVVNGAVFLRVDNATYSSGTFGVASVHVNRVFTNRASRETSTNASPQFESDSRARWK
jgi:hypothetical protein